MSEMGSPSIAKVHGICRVLYHVYDGWGRSLSIAKHCHTGVCLQIVGVKYIHYSPYCINVHVNQS